jgi:hypothetical protein
MSELQPPESAGTEPAGEPAGQAGPAGETTAVTGAGTATETELRPEVADYLAGMRRALADLPPTEVAEILEDVAAHLVEVHAELSGTSTDTLTTRLGTPESYAAELRSAAGYPPATTTPARGPARARLVELCLVLMALVAGVFGLNLGGLTGRSFPGVLLVCALVVLALALPPARLLRHPGGWAELRALPEVRRVTGWLTPPETTRSGQVLAYLRSLRGAWWLARVLVLDVVAVGLAAYRFDRGQLLLLTLVMSVPLAFGSVWFGRRAAADRRLLPVALPVNAFLIGALLAALATPGLVYQRFAAYQGVSPVYQPPGLSFDGHEVQNLYVFDAQGHPVPNVYVYDDRGVPVTVLPQYDCVSERAPRGTQDNRFPKPRAVFQNGVCRLVSGVPFSVVIPQGGDTPDDQQGSVPGQPSLTSTPGAPPPSTSGNQPSSSGQPSASSQPSGGSTVSTTPSAPPSK